MEKAMRVNVGETTRFRVLSEDQIEEILGTTLEILERVGVKVSDEEALTLLEKGGVSTEGGTLVRISPAMVQRALQTAPHRVVLANRDGQRDLIHSALSFLRKLTLQPIYLDESSEE